MSPLHVVSLLTLLSCAAAWEHVIYVDPLEGNNTQECIEGSVPCRNLSFAFQPEYRRSSTQYVLLPGTHYLDNNTYGSPFTDLDGLAIVGNGSNSSDTVIECNAPNSGLAFVGVSNIYLKRITFNTCAGLRNSTSRDFASENFAMQKSQAALYFYLCNNVSMSMVGVTNSPNATGVVMYDTIGTNRIEQSTFSNNRVEHTSPYPGGGGFYVEFSYCVPGDDNCTNDGSDITANQNATYLFSNCTFVHNKADSIDPTNASTFILPLGRDHIAFGRGGGLSIFLNGNASRNRVNIFNCSFDNNRALWGGGLFVGFHDTAGDNLVSVGGNTGFIGNKCFSTRNLGTGGGGMRIGHYVYGESVGMNTVTLHGCQFLGNSALNGGGLSISPTLQETMLNQVAFINVSDCCFQYNIARLGAAVEVAKFSLIIKGHMLHAQFTNCVFRYNKIHYLNSTLPYQTGVGSMYINEVHVSFRGDVLFERNTGSAVAVVGMPVDFMNCSANFTHNHGNEGGGIALLGSAWILINESTELYFYNNTAETHGGAIYNKYTDKESFASYANCFIRHYNPILQPHQWNATFLFRNNYQMNDVKKNAIFSTSILPCTRSGGSTWSNSSETLCWQGWDYNCSEEISSEAGTIIFNSTDKKKHTLKAYPGQPFHLPLIIEDDVHHNITTQTVFSASSNDTYIAMIEPSFTYISGEIVVVTGIENQTFILELDSAGDRVWHVEFTVELQNCPPGFKATSNNSEAKCECLHDGGFLGNIDCDMDSFNASLYNDYWMGVLPKHNNTLVVSHCPPNFCYHNPNLKQPSFPLPNSADKLDALICGSQNRKGILCGECKDGYGPGVNSEIYKCISCGNNTNIAANATYYVLSVYVPLFTLFAAIILFNIKLTTGPANAFIVYSQVVSSTFDLSADGQITITNDSRALQMVYKVPYGIFNLEFIENIISPLCLGTTLNIPDVISLDYLVAVFPLLMIVLVIFFMKLSSCIRSRLRRSTLCQSSRGISHLCGNWRLGEGLLHAFAAFLLLSYNKFSLVSSNLIQLVSAQTFYDENGTEITQDISFTGTPAIVLKYHLVGYIVFATFVVIPPLLLLEYPVKLLEWCINKVKCLQRFYPADKVHILLDTFQGCYRNKMRFFAGLYFLFRLIIDVSFVTANSWFKQSIVQQITCIVFIVLIALCQPYTSEKKIFNYIDTLMFANLALLNALSLYLYIYFQTYTGEPLPIPVFVIQYILLFLPLLYMVAYILYYLSSPCHNWINHHIQEVRLMCIRLFWNHNYHPLSEVIRDDASTTDETQNEDEIEALFERAKMDNTYQPNPNLTVPVAEVRMHGTGQRVKGDSSSDSGLRSHQSSINNYGSTASRTVSIHTPLFSSGQATGSSEPNTDD